jgi:hypothetical protein
LAADRRPGILIIDIRKRWPIRRKAMEWFGRTASIAGIQA